MTNEEEISLLEKVVENLWKPLIAGSVFPEEYIRDIQFEESFSEICEEFYLLVRDKHERSEEQFVEEKNVLFDKLDEFFETYPQIAYIEKGWNLRENLLWRPTWVKQRFRTAILEATMWLEILRLKVLINLKQQQNLKDEENVTEIKDQIEFSGVIQRSTDTHAATKAMFE